MKQSLQKLVESELPDADYPDFEPGDTIRVTTREEIGGQMRTRKFEGVCIARKGESPNETFKVRKVSFGIGVERVFPLHSPLIEDINVVRKGKVRRAKLNYLEGRSAKKSRIKDRRVDLEELNQTKSTDAEPRQTTGESVDAPPEESVEETEPVSEEETPEQQESTEPEEAARQEESADAAVEEEESEDEEERAEPSN